MRPTDIDRIPLVGAPTVHPDGARTVLSVGHADLGADAAVAQLCELRLAADGSISRRRLTRGLRDTAPQFSPDGTRLAFLRAPALDKPPQLAVMDARGGEPVIATDLPLGVESFRWSPDSSRLVLAARDPEPGRYGTVKGLDAAGEPPRRFTTLRYRLNGLGYTRDRRVQLWLLDAPSPDAEPTYPQYPVPPTSDAVGEGGHAATPSLRRLTDADADHSAPRFTPDGRGVAFVAALHDSREDDLCNDVWWVPLPQHVAPAPGESHGQHPADALPTPVRLTPEGSNLAVDDIEYGPDGRLWMLIRDLGATRTDFVGRGTSIALLDSSGLRLLTRPADFDFGEQGAGITVVDRGTVLSIHRERGHWDLFAIPDGGEPVAVVPQSHVTAHATAGGTLAVVRTTEQSVGDVLLIRGGVTYGPVDFSEPLRASGLRPIRELEIAARDGSRLQGWIVLPDGPGPHPVLLNIHGGPFTAYPASFVDEFQVYASAGYAVVYCNPRGSAGYGEDFARAIRHRMGTVDMTDVLDFLDGAIAAEPALDGSRVGIMGGSYGGYLTAWTIAHDHRFAGAIVERGFLDPESFIGTSDIGAYFVDEYNGADPDQRAAQSPQAVVGQVTTPTLVLHSELDLRCPLSQAERYYAALKRQGTETELVVFPGENHELSRAGRPRHRVQRFEVVLDWWSRHLPLRSDG